MSKKFLIVVALVVAAALPFFLFRKQKNSIKPPVNLIAEEKQEPQKKQYQEEIQEDLSLEQKAYRLGYQQGYNVFLNQINDPNAPNKSEEFTIFLDLPEEEKEIYKDIVTKGYVDGYHSCSELIHCPTPKMSNYLY